MTSGEEFVRKIRPVGCILFLALGAIVTVLCFTVNNDPVKGYEPQQDMAYYAANPQALQEELEQNIFPVLAGEETAVITPEGRVLVSLEIDCYYASRGAILQYFDESLLEFEKRED